MTHASQNGVLETKRIEIDLKGLTEEGEFEGFASTFGNTDEYGDVIREGAFKASIKNPKRIKMLWSHDMSNPIGVWQSFEENSKGLVARGQLALGVQRGKEAHELMRLGAVDALSIGFRVPKNGSQFENETRILTKIDLLEVSVVSIPANPKARIQAVKELIAEGSLPSEREFELMLTRDAGFSSIQAKTIISRGFKALGATRDAGDGLDELLASIRKTAEFLSPIEGH